MAVDGGAAAGGAAAAVLRGHAGLHLPRPHRGPLLRRQGHAGHRGQVRGHGLEVRYKIGVDKCFNISPNYRTDYNCLFGSCGVDSGKVCYDRGSCADLHQTREIRTLIIHPKYDRSRDVSNVNVNKSIRSKFHFGQNECQNIDDAFFTLALHTK